MLLKENPLCFKKTEGDFVATVLIKYKLLLNFAHMDDYGLINI